MAELAGAVFSFENVLPDLAELPIAARRALDHAGLRLSLEGWRSLPLEERHRLVIAGGADVIDASLVAAITSLAAAPPRHIEAITDPDPDRPPEALAEMLRSQRPMDELAWARLRPLDRYALTHAYRRALARNDPALLRAAYDCIVGHTRSGERVSQQPPRLESSIP